MLQMKVKGYTTDGEERNYDIFIHNDPSLCRLYPVWMIIRDRTVIEVRPAWWLVGCALVATERISVPCVYKYL